MLKTAAIRLLVFDDRIEIVNPGCVVGGHTIEEVKKGNSFARNPLLAKFCAQTMPYRGLGSGIPRVLAEKSKVDFLDDKEGNQFTAIVSRPDIAENSVSSQESVEDTTQKTTQKTTQIILTAIHANASITRKELADLCGISSDGIKWQLKHMQEKGLIRRIGPDKGGHWEVVEDKSE